MGLKSSIIPQLNFLTPELILKSHRATRLTGIKCIQAEAAIRAAGMTGMTPREIELKFIWMSNTAGPRLAEVRDLGYIRQTEAMRNHQHIWIHTGKVVTND